MKNSIYNKLFALICILFLTNSLFAQLDTSFDGDGIQTAQIGASNDGIDDIAIDNIGKIVCVGTYFNVDSQNEIFVLRYNSDGSLDNSFDSDGIKTIEVGGIDDRAYGVDIQGDGKIVIAGKSWFGSYYDLAIIRLNNDGSFDSNFNGDGNNDGIITENAMFGGNTHFNTKDLEISNDGKIIVTGFQENPFVTPVHDQIIVYKFNSDGSLDQNFSDDGKLNVSISARDSEPEVIKLQSDGDIIVGGYTTDSRDFFITGISPSGSLIPKFTTITQVGSGTDQIFNMDIYDDDKIIVVGNTYVSTYTDVALARYSADGNLDNTFGSGGIVTTNFGENPDNGYDYSGSGTGIRILSNGQIIVGAHTNSSGDGDFAVIRYNFDGTLDNSYNGNGIAVGGFVNNQENSRALAVQNDGKIVVGGDILSGTWDVVIMRFGGDIAPLPVELTSFSASLNAKKVVLNWQTATEVNNYGFEILRSAQNDSHSEEQSDEESWEKIGFVQGHGNSNSPKYYSYKDEKSGSGTISYRLRQIDTDGKFEYSEIVKVEIEEQHLTKFELYQNYPNPFNPSTTIKFAIPSVVTSPDRIGTKQSVQTSLKIYDILGREVATLVNETLKPGNYEVNFDANRLSSGMYFYSLTTSGKTIIKKMMLIR